ncbi:hypothetical protein [Trueperella pecoris]|uniref:hypothetical protein n=1 Tax=Trueperella pecoris TaxID=2733571 RepID=UPI001ABEE5B5|nr:hypothetical protein [Trueperella pecoris]QTG75457.1 hypothetical protein J4179_09720 [Trueperella pecoris]
MEFMEWALFHASRHPELEHAVVTANDEWLDILLSDGRTFRFRPGALIKPDAPLDRREDLLNRLITIGVQQAREAETNGADLGLIDSPIPNPAHESSSQAVPGYALAHQSADQSLIENAAIVPIVRVADFFLPPSPQAESMVYLPLTDFLAVGIAYDLPDTIQPIFYADLDDTDRDLGEMMAEAVTTLRFLTNENQQTVELGITTIAGAHVMTFLRPTNYELSWFADLDMIQQIAERMGQERPDEIPLFVPASRTKLFVVYSEDPHLVDFFKLLLAQRDSPDAVYPLPHTVAADGWLEWQPFPDSELAQILGALRNHFRERIYGAQEKMMKQWLGFGEVKPFAPRRLSTGERVSTTTWDASDKHGSIPMTDFLTFTRSASPHPWEELTPVNITVRTHVAREIWPEGFTQDETVWPPRLILDGFPDEDTLNKMEEAAGRRF